MPQYTVRDEASGKVVTFDWSGTEPPGESDLADVFAEAVAPVSSHEAVPTPDEARTWTDTAVDALPLIGGMAGGMAGAALGPLAIGTAAIGGAGGEGFRRTINALRGKGVDASAGETIAGITRSGAEQGIGQAVGMGAAAGLAKAGKLAMRGAVGAQTALRRKFPTVDLEDIALREGVGLPGTDIPKAASAASKGVSAAGRAADAGGAAKIQPREITKGLRPLYDRATQTRRPDAQREIVEAANSVRNTFRGGIGVEDALATKSDLASQASQVMQGAANPRSASTAKKILGAESRALGKAAKARGPGVGEALERSQELMALEEAVKSMANPSRLRLVIGGGAGAASGFGSGDPLQGVQSGLAMYALTSPRSLSLLGQLLAKGAPVGREGARLLATLMSSHDE